MLPFATESQIKKAIAQQPKEESIDIPTPTIEDAGKTIVVDDAGKFALGEAVGGGSEIQVFDITSLGSIGYEERVLTQDVLDSYNALDKTQLILVKFRDGSYKISYAPLLCNQSGDKTSAFCFHFEPLKICYIKRTGPGSSVSDFRFAYRLLQEVSASGTQQLFKHTLTGLTLNDKPVTIIITAVTNSAIELVNYDGPTRLANIFFDDIVSAQCNYFAVAFNGNYSDGVVLYLYDYSAYGTDILSNATGTLTDNIIAL